MSHVATPSDTIPAAVSQRLHALRTKLMFWLSIDGLSRILLAVVVIALCDLVIDWLFQMDKPQRVVMLLLMIGGVGAVGWWRLVRPMSALPGDDALCLQVEQAHHDLGQTLISAVQLSRIKDFQRTGISPQLVQATIDLGVQRAKNVNFADVLHGARMRFNLVLLGAMLLVLGGGAAAIANTETFSIWFNRNILLGDDQWPQKTYLKIHGVGDDNTVELPRGGDKEYRVEVTEQSIEYPEAVYVEFLPVRGRPSQPLAKTSKSEFKLEFVNVMEEFQFRVYGGDGRTPWVKVKLVDPPAVEELELVVTPPAYTGEKPKTLPAGRGPYYVLKGSSLNLRGTANKPLTAGKLQIGAKEFPLEILAEKFSVELSSQDLAPGAYQIHLTDTRDLDNKKRLTVFTMRTLPDRAPRLRAELIGVKAMVTPHAQIPFSCRVSDDYSVTKVWLTHYWRDQETKSPEKQQTFDDAQKQLPAREIELESVWDLEPLNIPVGSSLSIQFRAHDNDNISGPNEGKSAEFLIRVVTEDQLRTDLLRRETEQRQEFERLVQQQDDLMTETQALLAEASSQSEMSVAQKQKLMQLQRDQKVLGANVESIANRLDGIVKEVLNNKLEEENGPLIKRLQERIIRPMKDLAELGSPEAVRRLDKSRRLADQPEDRNKSLEEAAQQQQENVAVMKDILKHMVEAEGYQQAVNMLYQVEKTQRSVHQMTEEERRERIRKILEEGKKIEEKK